MILLHDVVDRKQLNELNSNSKHVSVVTVRSPKLQCFLKICSLHGDRICAKCSHTQADSGISTVF